MFDTIREWPRYVKVPFPIAKVKQIYCCCHFLGPLFFWVCVGLMIGGHWTVGLSQLVFLIGQQEHIVNSKREPNRHPKHIRGVYKGGAK